VLNKDAFVACLPSFNRDLSVKKLGISNDGTSKVHFYCIYSQLYGTKRQQLHHHKAMGEDDNAVKGYELAGIGLISNCIVSFLNP